MKKIYKLLLIYIFILVFNLILYPLGLDEVWNYGFSYSISRGLIPYKDFNMVVTPLYPFIMSIFLMFNHNILVFHIFNSLLVLGIFYITYKLIGNKSYIVLISLFLPCPIIYPSYNILLLFLLLILIYLEEDKYNDLLIGIVLGLIILTKQSVGVVISLIGIVYYIKNRDKLFKRLSGLVIVSIIFLIYLIISKSLYNFIDLCILGLFDFGGNNTSINILTIISIIIFIYSLYYIRDKKDIINYYLIGFYSIVIPLFDIYHVGFLLFSFILLLVRNTNIKYNYKYMFIGIIIGISIVLYKYNISTNSKYPNNINNFNYRYIDNNRVILTNNINKYLDTVDNYMFLDSNGYYFKIIREDNITYLDLINMGNLGYNGNSKLFNKIKGLNNYVFLIDKSELDRHGQINKDIIYYVINKGHYIKSIGLYDIYKLGE